MARCSLALTEVAGRFFVFDAPGLAGELAFGVMLPIDIPGMPAMPGMLAMSFLAWAPAAAGIIRRIKANIACRGVMTMSPDPIRCAGQGRRSRDRH